MDKCLAIFVVPQSLYDKRRKMFCLQVFFNWVKAESFKLQII